MGSKTRDYGIPIVAVIGWHNSGKTTVIERLLAEFKARGLRVAVIKHTGEEAFQVDHSGTDTWRFAESGADVVAIASRRRLALMEDREDEIELEDLLALLRDRETGGWRVEMVLLEGFKRSPTLKIEVVDLNSDQGRIEVVGELVAVVYGTPGQVGGGTTAVAQSEGEGIEQGDGVPQFTPEQTRELADLLQARGHAPTHSDFA